MKPPAAARLLPGLSSRRAGRRIGLAALVLVFGTDGLQNAVANGDTRSLSFSHLHTRETITVTFKRDGRFDEGGLAQLNKFLRDWRNDEQTTMDPRLFDIIWQVYQEAGGSQPVQIISAYRSPATNAMLRRRSRGVAEFSQHTLGKAIDFNIPGVSLDKIRDAGLRLQRGGVGFYPSSGSPFVHLDVGNVRHWPRLSPEALAAVFPDGRTVHIPSSGRPMPGYALALADIARRNAREPGDGPAPSASTTIQTASLDRSPRVTGQDPARQGWLGRLFSGSWRAGERDGQPAQMQPAPSAPQNVAPAAPAQVAALPVPMPRSRPQPAQPAPVTVAGRFSSPADIINSRGFWGGPEMQAMEPSTVRPQPAAPLRIADASPLPAAAADQPVAGAAAGESRMVWRVGRQPAPQPPAAAPTITASVTPPARTPAPRPRPESTMASLVASTADVPWPGGAREEDRAQGDLVLAYASPTDAAPVPSARARPMGVVRVPPPSARQQAAAAPAPAPAAASTDVPSPAGNRLSDNPWLRAIILAPSLHGNMQVSITGEPDYAALTPLMHKPTTVIANGFAVLPPNFGLNSRRFSGSAIATIEVIRFRPIRLGMN